jgi:hypothetical protein
MVPSSVVQVAELGEDEAPEFGYLADGTVVDPDLMDDPNDPRYATGTG